MVLFQQEANYDFAVDYSVYNGGHFRAWNRAARNMPRLRYQWYIYYFFFKQHPSNSLRIPCGLYWASSGYLVLLTESDRLKKEPGYTQVSCISAVVCSDRSASLYFQR